MIYIPHTPHAQPALCYVTGTWSAQIFILACDKPRARWEVNYFALNSKVKLMEGYLYTQHLMTGTYVILIDD